MGCPLRLLNPATCSILGQWSCGPTESHKVLLYLYSLDSQNSSLFFFTKAHDGSCNIFRRQLWGDVRVMGLVQGDGDGSQCCKKDVSHSFTQTDQYLQVVFYAFGHAIYNIYFHPLAKFRGPKRAVVSNVGQNRRSFACLVI